MSSQKDKKAALLAKIQRQKAKQKEQIYTIPTIKLSTVEKQRKAYLPNIKTLAKKSENEDNMREFLTGVNNLSEFDFDIPPNGYNDPIILNGYNSYISAYKMDTIDEDNSKNHDFVKIKKDAQTNWIKLPLYRKKIWVIKGYSEQKNAEWGRKQFADLLIRIIHSETTLNKFITDYLEMNLSYDKFITFWNNKSTETQEIHTDEEILSDTRLDVTEEEQLLIKDQKDQLTVYETELATLEENITISESILDEQSHFDLVEMVTPIMNNKTKEELISTILNSKYFLISTKKYKKLGSHDYNKYSIKLDKKMKKRKIILDKLSHDDLVLEILTKKSKKSMVQFILYDEYNETKENLINKILSLSIKIKNLSLGKYIPRTDTKHLKYKEKLYLDALLIHIRRLELKTMTLDQLYTYANTIDLNIPFQIDHDSLINLILTNEFPNKPSELQIPTVNYNQMKSVLITLPDNQIHILASSLGIKNPDKQGKHYNIDSILRIKFPEKKKKQTISLLEGGNIKSWDKSKRSNELNVLSSNELKQEAVILGIDIPKGISDSVIITKILNYEERTAKLISKEDMEKEKLIQKISKLMGTNKERYSLWSYEELKQRLSALKDEHQEYWTELEQERLYNKLSAFVDIKDRKYSKSNKWNIKKLRKELEKIGGDDWENYKPLIEDYSFVNCMEKYNTYDWIEGKVTAVWLSSPDGTIPPLDYISDDIAIVEDGHRWYQANKKYFALQCNKYKNKRTQKGDVLKCTTQNGKTVEFTVGYTIVGYKGNKYKSRTHMVNTNDGRSVQRTFIIQNEALFNMEKRYERYSNQNENEKIIDILNSYVTEKTSTSVKNVISRSLLDIAPLKKDYGIIHYDTNRKRIDSNTPYMQILMQSLRDSPEQTNKELFTKAANIVVYLNIPEAQTFIANIEKEYYLPEILATLSPSEKFPEVYQDPKLTGKFIDDITANIDNKIYKFVYNLGLIEYMDSNPSMKKRTDTNPEYTRSIKTNKRLNACENKTRVKGIPDTDIVYYKEDGKIYCFSVDELYDRLIINENITNPETNKQFDIEFIRRYGELYNKKLSDDGLINTYFQKKYGFDIEKLANNKENNDTRKRDIPDIAPDLWNRIGNDIAELEDQLSNEQPGDGDIIDENREEERREVEVEEGIRETIDIDENDACEYCHNHLSDDSIKSIIFHNNESRIIKFCSFKCFENKNDWNKYKIKKDKKAKKKEKKEKKEKKSIVKPDADKHVKLTKEEKQKRKKIIKQQVKEGTASFDKVGLPLMTRPELLEYAKKKNIKIPGNLSKMDIASFLYKKLHPTSTKGIFKEKTAKKEMIKFETRREKKKRKEKAEKKSKK